MVTFSIVERREQQHCLLPSTYLERAKQRVHKKKTRTHSTKQENVRMYACLLRENKETTRRTLLPSAL